VIAHLHGTVAAVAPDGAVIQVGHDGAELTVSYRNRT